MRLQEAVELIAGGVSGGTGLWLDLGAGEGLFTRALAERLDPGARIVAIDTNASALRQLASAAAGKNADRPRIEVLVGDYHEIGSLLDRIGRPIAGALFANSLHYSPTPGKVLGAVASELEPDGRILIVEYEGRRPNPWVPFPVPIARLRELASEAGLHPPRIIGQRPSAFGGSIYSAVLEVRGG